MAQRRKELTWDGVYREICEIDDLTLEILARWQRRIDAALEEVSCCIEIGEVLRSFRMRAWEIAKRQHRQGQRARATGQMKLF
ncbi:hypothetical protein A3F52_05150 [Candidatus Uhrbacteria bacterium RIFCSPHIGHO2_12_FULL_47_11]|nr:MAG: hypothetical protein A2753_00085 [Candidatus Uhrbacteria bacterium RIFCSPHIGHO2_01_FULL_47_11]OGL68185.1 MAG: hypothetical protein A3D58_04190 [Candidatus Uhrbacteria bacterium RIFCSPHIGHO2_02_FULL_46_47]OGL76026.1 MAG: hypothetical protein A3F52_05150 [Candidatus Uhrbacteria bacterium RIFCSPHIGHO2_12_FULL_47_11]OGL83823.1 MAG: hypothetical protein A3J03_02870 [Candidatus Uhrbacteria bacterium RIFCSPLOWO2_02_FULL_46_25]OGL92366.1 MAG: hypothetical protein A3H11_03275 [Candidatus Uhrbact